MADIVDAPPRPFIGPSESFASVGLDVAGIAFGHPLGLRWWLAFVAALGLLGLLAIMIVLVLDEGVGVWGNNVPVTWALDIVAYDWWIGIASGGLLISAVLMLFGTEWRGALNRLTETGALIAAAAAACYPIIHLGRPWFFYWNLPYPNTLALWPQFRSPLYWDAVDIISYLMVALTFWTIGLLPDLATLRDRAIERWRETGQGRYRAYLYGIFALGWRGSARHWNRWLQAYRIVAVMGVLLVFSLQTGAAVMFAGAVEPGWHDPLLPIAFVAGAILSGVAFMAAAAVVVRRIFRLEGLITDAHLHVMAVLMLVLGLVNLYCYADEIFTTLLGNDPYETAVLGRRLAGPHAWAFWDVLLLALVPVHVFWFRAARRSGLVIALVGVLVNSGIFGDHYMVIVTTLQHDFLPSSAHEFSTAIGGVATFVGSVGLFFTLALLGLRYLPIVSIVEVRRLSALGASAKADVRGGRPMTVDEGTVGEAPIHAVAAEFDSGDALLAGVEALKGRDLGRLDAHSPVPIRGMGEALGLPSSAMSLIAIVAVLAGFAAMMGMCLYATAADYVFNIGGRPLISWPAFVVPSVSFALMTGAVATYVAMLFLNRLPRLNHPAFNIPDFTRVTQDRYFLTVAEGGHDLDVGAIEAALDGLSDRPLRVTRVPR